MSENEGGEMRYPEEDQIPQMKEIYGGMKQQSMASVASSELTHQIVSTEGLQSNRIEIHGPTVITAGDINNLAIQERNNNVVQKMCHMICGCFTCFNRPEEGHHEYNYV